MSRNILGTIGARRNVKVIPKKDHSLPSLPRDVKGVMNSKEWDIWENSSGEKFLVTGTTTTGFGDSDIRFIEKIPVELRKDETRKAIPRAWDTPVTRSEGGHLEKGEDGKVVPTKDALNGAFPRKYRRYSKSSSTTKRSTENRAEMLGLHYPDVENKEEYLQKRWNSELDVTKKEIRLLGLYLSETTGVGPYAPEFKSMKTRWGSARHKTEKISFFEELDEHSRIWAYHVMIHEYAHIVRRSQDLSGTSHDENFKEIERKLHRRFGLDVEYYNGGVYAILDAETEERLVMDGDEDPEDLVDRGF